MGFLVFLVVLLLLAIVNGTAIYYAAVLAKGENIDIISTCKLVFWLYVLLFLVSGVFGPGQGANGFAPMIFTLAINVIFFYVLVNKMAIRGTIHVITFVVMSVVFTIIGIMIFNFLIGLLVFGVKAVTS